MSRTFHTHFRKAEHRDWFTKDNYDYIPFCNSRYASSNANMLARLQNTFISAFNQTKKSVLPRYILVILDDDLITFLDFKSSDGAATLLGSWVEWLVKEFNAAINARLEKLKNKYKKGTIFMYWLTAPTHKNISKGRNSLRMKFNLSLESVVKTQQSNMRVIRLKEHWDTQDSTLVVNDRMTETGLSAYWRAIDATFKYNEERREIYIAKKMGQKVLNPVPVQKSNDREDPMHSFFKKKKYEENHMDSREDCGRHSFHRKHFDDGRHKDTHSNWYSRRHEDRFMLPRLKYQY